MTKGFIMAGHSQFKNIMYRKGAQDAKRAKIFTKIAREITVAVKENGEDINANPKLRLAIHKGRAVNMPKDNIDRAIKRALGNDSENYESVRYEGYGIAGVAIIVEALTDNRNRTGGNIRSCFSKAGGALGETGSVTFSFDHVGHITYPLSKGDEDTILMAAIEAGASDCKIDGDVYSITTSFEDLGMVAKELEHTLGIPESVTPVWVPNNTTPIDDKDKAEKLIKLISALEEDDDVQNVYANFEISDEIMSQLSI
jgi:YebC/PmpR family DNA-binding regulatory protein